MVIEQIDLSLAYFAAGETYFTLVSKQIGTRREQTLFMSSSFVATLLSFRKIAEFFTVPTPRKRKRFPDDITAAQFGFLCSSPLDENDMEELSQYTAHFTKKGEALRSRGFAVGRLGALIYARCLEFFEFLEKNSLDNRVLADRQMIARFRKIRRLILKAAGP